MLVFRRLTLIITLVLLANFALWALVNRSVSERAWGGIINSLSYSGYQSGDTSNHMSDEEIDREVGILADHTHSLRTYGVSDGLDRQVSAAGRHNLNVTLGAWISRDAGANAAEVSHAIDVVHANPNVQRLLF
jgi:exo-beta-1,3-glucanase (GH17 family)